MKAVILAGGYGTRISNDLNSKPKPLIEIGNYPIIWHIMKVLYYYKLSDFIVTLGYKGYEIKKFFLNYNNIFSNLTIDLKKNKIKYHNHNSENWKIDLIETGLNTNTAGRVRQAIEFNKKRKILLTYGDGIGNINIPNLIKFHNKNNKIATVTAVSSIPRFGKISVKNDIATKFEEKPKNSTELINAGFFILEPEILNYINHDSESFENEPLSNLASEGQLSVYKHDGFWHPCDVPRDKKFLEDLWNKKPPWKIW